MKILHVAILLMASLAFVLIGCSDTPTSLSAGPAQGLSAPAGFAKVGTVTHTATGCARVREFWGYSYKTEFSFSATLTLQGISSGEVVLTDQSSLKSGGEILKFRGEIFSLQVEGNRAKLNWTYASGPWTGMYGCTVVEDNGEGANSRPDKASVYLWTDGSDLGRYTISQVIAMSPNEYIDWLEDYVFVVLMGMPAGTPALEPTDHGNVQVQ